MNATLARQIEPEPKTYTLTDDDGAQYQVTEGAFQLHYFDSEKLLIKDQLGSFIVPWALAFEAFTGYRLLPPLDAQE